MNMVAQVKRAGLDATTELSLLYAQPCRIEAAAIAAELGKRLPGERPEVVEDSISGAHGVAVLQVGGCEIVIDVVDSPRPASAFANAIDWPMLHRTFPDAGEVVPAHKACVRITVVAEYDLVAQDMGVDTANTCLARSMMAGHVATVLCRLTPPTAVYWQSCEMLFKPTTFLREFEMQPVAVFTRVTPFSSNRRIGGVRVVGGSTKGAALLLGKEAVLEEAPVPVAWMMTTLHSFLAASEAEGAYLPHLSIYSPTQGDAIIVRHQDHSPEIPEPHVSLEVRRVADIGFDADRVYEIGETQAPARRNWDGRERRTRPASAKPFGRRGLV